MNEQYFKVVVLGNVYAENEEDPFSKGQKIGTEPITVYLKSSLISLMSTFKNDTVLDAHIISSDEYYKYVQKTYM